LRKDITSQHKKHIKRKVLLGLGLTVVLVTCAVCSLKIGAYPLSARQILSAIAGNENDAIAHVVWGIRLPRMLVALVAGACLAMAGASMQNVLKNPLASPFTLGISQGAAFGAAFAIIVLDAGNFFITGNEHFVIRSPYLVVVSAFAGSLITVIALIVLSALRDMSPAALILAGVAFGSFFGAATMLLQYFASDIQVAAAVFWTFGDLGKAQWTQIGFMALVMGAAAIFFTFKRWHFNAMLWGDDTAKSLGVNVRSLRLMSLVWASLLTSVTIAFLGIVGFIGLVAPHIVRMVVGQDHRFLLPYSALFGALLLLISDVFARTVMAPIVLPVGILTSFAGVPIFLYLLIRHREISS
jgi:iron complex transport system permease protein